MKRVSAGAILSGWMAAGLILSPLSALALEVDANSNVQVGVGGSASSSGSVQVGANGSAGSQMDEDGLGDMSERPDEDDSNSGATVSLWSQVSSDSDLEVYTSNVQESNAEIREIHMADSELTVGYAHKGRLFGFIPVRISSKTGVVVDESGNTTVTTRMPWWNMFVTGTHSISSSIDSELSGSSSVAMDFSADASASERARVIDAIVKAHASFEAKVQAEAESTAKSY